MSETTADRYAIRADYRAREVARPCDDSGLGDYWNAGRIEASTRFQWHVYRLARRLARRHGYRSVLDVGSGPATKLARLLAPQCPDAVCVDRPSSAELVAKMLPGARFVAADLDGIDLDLGRRFDLVICADVLEHLGDPDPCTDFIRRHLAPTGRALLSTPDRVRLRGPDCLESPHPEHVREWSGAEFRSYLGARGFAVEHQRWFPLAREAGAAGALRGALGTLGLCERWAPCQALVCRSAPLAARDGDVTGGPGRGADRTVEQRDQRRTERRQSQREEA